MRFAPNFYFDVEVAPDLASPTGRLGGAADLLATALHVAHGVSRLRQIPFASAFPLAHSGESPHPGDVFRVFAASKAYAELLLGQIGSHRVVRETTRRSTVIAVDDRWTEDELVQFRRVRQDTLKSALRHASSFSGTKEQSSESLAGNHLGLTRRHAQLVRNDSFPYLRSRSSTGQSFSLRFEVVNAESRQHAEQLDEATRVRMSLRHGEWMKAVEEHHEPRPDSWGLSRATAPVWLPALPVESLFEHLREREASAEHLT